MFFLNKKILKYFNLFPYLVYTKSLVFFQIQPTVTLATPNSRVLLFTGALL